MEKFVLVFFCVLLLQVPGCLIVLADDAGQINYFKYEGLIKFAIATFAAPLRYLVTTSPQNITGIYIGNLALLSCMAILLLIAWKHIQNKRKK